MLYLLCRHLVTDYQVWRAVFDSHAPAQRDTGLEVLHVLRGVDSPNMITMIFRVHDRARAEAFMSAPEAREAGKISGVIGEVEIHYLRD